MEGTVQVLEELECLHLLFVNESNSCPSEYPLILLEEWHEAWFFWVCGDGVIEFEYEHD